VCIDGQKFSYDRRPYVNTKRAMQWKSMAGTTVPYSCFFGGFSFPEAEMRGGSKSIMILCCAYAPGPIARGVDLWEYHSGRTQWWDSRLEGTVRRGRLSGAEVKRPQE